MLKKTDIFPGTFACMLALGSMPSASAGDVKLVSDTLDNVCMVEITWGPEAPNGTPVEHHTDVPRNWSITSRTGSAIAAQARLTTAIQA